MALATGAAEVPLDVPVLGPSPLGPRALRGLRRTARGFDLVIAYGSTTLPACAIALLGAKTPFIYRSIGDPTAWVRGRLHRLRTSLLLRRASTVVTLWPGAEQSMRALYGVPAARLRSIPNARSADEFHPPSDNERAAARRRYGLTDDQFVVAVIGSLTREKRVDLALSAVALVPGANLLVAGDGPERDRLTSAANTNPGLVDRVQFLGSVQDILPVVHASDILLLTSRTEGMPGVLIEAGLSALPTVATAVGAVPWLLHEGVVAGQAVGADATADEIARALMAQLAGDKLGTAADTPCRWDRVASRWCDELDRIITSSSLT